MDDTALESLVRDDIGGRALASVLAHAERGDGTLTYDAVSDAVDAETWGRLLRTGVLVAADGVFVVDDPPAVRDALADAGIEVGAATAQPAPTTDESAWRPVDKLAGAGAITLVAGYQVPAIKAAIVGPMDLVLGPLAGVLPFPLLVVVLATAVALVSTGFRRRFLDEDGMDAQREQMQRVREKLSTAKQRGDDAAVERLTERQQELMRDQLGTMKNNLRPIAWSMLITVPVFLWLSWFVMNPAGAIVTAAPVIPIADRIIWSARLVGPMQVWMVWYFVSSLVSNLFVKRTASRLFDQNPAQNPA
ncbi:DUF106 domain-containing protein [Haloferax sp. Atlit-10N]|uniref:DUF106 domain-containing protein n=1 Tax=Haloferax TaxID=2251 RepID=UPI0006795C45|nr:MULTISPECIES: EMC3/TMCO1 family protein [Haloferax]RDZ42522.1 DUF106 domain-containing protein [Haloferax sp. Atlit-16N]RDZ57395.1 DUF106 domain-containing protein [Haloferax sp. Atlit-10N]